MVAPLFVFASTARRMHDGPLGRYVDGFADFLRERGHPREAIRTRIRLMADLSRWLKRRGQGVRNVTAQGGEEFLRSRWRRIACRRGERGRLFVLCDHLRQRGVLPRRSRPTQAPGHPLERAFAQYLSNDRALTRATLVNYLPFIRLLLTKGDKPTAARFRADAIIQFVLRQAQKLNPGRAKLMVTALRAFFRFLRLRGEVSSDLAACVPAIRDWRLTTLPKSLHPEEVERVLEACNPNSPAGRRDHAILLLLARLGLRAGEIVGLELEDVNWEAGEITVRGKGAYIHRLPMPRDVGKALVDYLRHGRPKACTSRRVFIQAHSPFKGLASSPTVSTLVMRAIVRAGLRPARMGAHLFRHTLASQMLRRGATLAEIGEVLRHRHPDTTAIYAKVDVERLHGLAQPWPGGHL